MSRVAIIGCGNIGYRHLQGVAATSGVAEIHVVEPNGERLAAVMSGPLRPSTRATLAGHQALEALEVETFDLVISAVTADLGVSMAEALARLNARTLLLEKPLGQSVADLERLDASLGGAGRAVLVNCPRGLWAGYAAIGARLRASEPVRVEITGNLWGYGCNAVHFLELFRSLTHGGEISATGAQLAAAPGGSKRGGRFEEFVGTASYVNARGDTLQLTCGSAGAQVVGCVVVVREGREAGATYLVDEPAGTILRMDGKAPGLEPLGLLYVSQSTTIVLEQLMSGGVPALPTLEQALDGHRAFFESLTMSTGRNTFAIT